jgi:hypothetical protein
MSNIKLALDILVSALNYFPGWKTKAGAVLQVVGTILLAYNSAFSPLFGWEFPQDIVLAVNAAAATLVAVGAANQPSNNKN